jgi:hypothetical protein
MKFRFWMMGLAAFLALGIAAAGTTYYVDDNSNDGDVYTPDLTGNDANDGLTPSTPKLTLNNLLASTNLLPGDAVLIDTGTYTNNVVIGANVNGVATNRILFRGSPDTRPWGGGTIFTGSGDLIDVRGNYLKFQDIRMIQGGRGLFATASHYGEYERIYAVSNNVAVTFTGSNSNAFRRCVFATYTASAGILFESGKGNYMENCVVVAPQVSALLAVPGTVSNIVDSIVIGLRASTTGYTPDAGSYNILYGSLVSHGEYETLAEWQRINTNWHHNTVADPKFANPEGFDFHLLSAAGFVSNGVWVTNPAVGYSPGIDFGARE